MSFSGKKFRRTGYENVGKIAQCSDPFIQTMKKYPPVFCFTRINEYIFNYWLQTRDQHLTFNFRLGQEHHMEKRDGSKISMTFTLENDNVLRQIIKQPDGKICCFRKEFGTNDAKMVARRLVQASRDKRARAFLAQRISIAIQRGNAASLLGTIPRDTDLGQAFYL